MYLEDYKVGDFVYIQIDNNICNVRIIQKGRKDKLFLKCDKGKEIKVKPIGQKERFISHKTKVIQKESKC